MLESDQSRRNGGVHSFKKGKDMGAVIPRGDQDTAPVERIPGVGGQMVDI